MAGIFYLDVRRCSFSIEMYFAQSIYDNDLIRISEYHIGANATYHAITSGQILGAEATLWSEKVWYNYFNTR